MIRLLPDTATQNFNSTPFEARKFLASFTKYLVVFQSQATREVFTVVGATSVDNARYTTFDISTSTDDALNGSIKITESGMYSVTIYGQNSTTNLDTSDASVVGICEKGLMQIIGETAWTMPTITVPDNVVYYE